MKCFKWILPCIILMFGMIVYADNFLNAIECQYKINWDTEEMDFNSPIVTINDVTYIPIRELGEQLGYQVEWEESRQVISIAKDKNSIPNELLKNQSGTLKTTSGEFIYINPTDPRNMDFTSILATLNNKNEIMVGFIDTPQRAAEIASMFLKLDDIENKTFNVYYNEQYDYFMVYSFINSSEISQAQPGSPTLIIIQRTNGQLIDIIGGR